jgi:hypothetical protein
MVAARFLARFLARFAPRTPCFSTRCFAIRPRIERHPELTSSPAHHLTI